MSLEVLFLSPRLCWPLDSGRRLREFHLAKAVSEKARLTILTFGDEAAVASEGLPFCEVIAVPPPRRYTPGNLVRGLIGAIPLPVLNYTSGAMQQQLRKLLAGRSFDIVQVESIALWANLHGCEAALPASRIVYNWHDIESERMERFSRQSGSSAKRMYARLTARRLRQLERRILASGAAHVVCSEQDRQKLAADAPPGRLGVVPNGVDVGSFAGVVGRTSTERNRILFVGAMNYDPNVQAVSEFATRAWPGIRLRFPHLRFTVVGSNPTAAVQALGRLPGIEVTGTVPDVRPYYADAFCVVVPLRVGTGTRLKIVEAMAAGVPVISTAVGAEGLPVKHGETFLLAEQPEQWEAGVARLEAEPALRAAIQANGLALVGESFDWRTIGRKLLDFYDIVISGERARTPATVERTNCE